MITYADKVQGAVNPKPENQKFTFQNANEIKHVVNTHETVLYNITCDFMQANGDDSAKLTYVSPFAYKIDTLSLLHGSAAMIELFVNDLVYTLGTVINPTDKLDVFVTAPVDYVVNLNISN